MYFEFDCILDHSLSVDAVNHADSNQAIAPFCQRRPR